jgi:hypothetical protein
MEGSCSTGQSPQWAVVPVEEEEMFRMIIRILIIFFVILYLFSTFAPFLLC